MDTRRMTKMVFQGPKHELKVGSLEEEFRQYEVVRLRIYLPRWCS